MWLFASAVALAATIVVHAGVRRAAPRLGSFAVFFAVGGIVGLALLAFVWGRWGFGIESWAAAIAYAFACELHIFLFSSVSGSISASLLYQLRARGLSSADIEDRFGGKAMVERRLSKMVSAGVLQRTASGYVHTEPGIRLLWIYRQVRTFFCRAPAPGMAGDLPRALDLAAEAEMSAAIRRYLANVTAVLAIALLPLLLFWRHLTGNGVFVGDSDRLNHFLSTLNFLTRGYREGRLLSWSENLFAGYPMFSFAIPYPTSIAALLWPREKLFFAAGVVSCALIACAGWAAYAFIRDLKVRPYPAFVGAALYILCAYNILKISQSDITYAAVVLIPLGMLAIRRTADHNLVKCYAALTLIMGYLMLFGFLQKTAYALLLFTAYAIYRGAIKKSWRIPLVYSAAGLTAFLAAFPRIFAVGTEFLQSARQSREAYRNFDKLYSASGLGVHEALRWFDDRIFGRFYSEVIRLGNNFNMHEGMLLYMSAFAAFFLIYSLAAQGRFARLLRSGERDEAFFLSVAVFSFVVVTTKTGYHVLHWLFFDIEFIHTRIVIAAALPICALVARLLDQEFQQFADTPEDRLFVLVGVGGAILLNLLIEYLASRYGASAINLRLPAHVFQVLKESLARIGLSLLVLAALLWLAHRPSTKLAVRRCALVAVGMLMVSQAFYYASFQLTGPHTRDRWPPFKTPDHLLAGAGEFSGPSTRALALMANTLETINFRTSFVCPREVIDVFCPPHLAHFWNLRSIEGYLYAVPEGIAYVPWGPDTTSLRALRFNDAGKLPWGVLGLYNVKYAIGLSPELITNKVRLQSGSARELEPKDIVILRNPLPVADRVFFARSVVAVNDVKEASKLLFGKNAARSSYDPVEVSVVEGLGANRRFSAVGRIDAKFDEDVISIRLEPADADRFLVINERFDARWKAMSGTRELAIYPTNVLMRGLVIPAGVATVALKYQPSILSWAFYGTAICAMLLSIVLLTRISSRS
jgi:hypothetical protein